MLETQNSSSAMTASWRYHPSALPCVRGKYSACWAKRCRKSTTINIITGLIRKDEGKSSMA